MKIIVNPHKCEIEKTPVNEKEINITKVEFEFADEITQDYVKEAYFTLNGSTYMQIIQNDECDIPYEVLEEQGTLEIGVVAYLLENTRTLAEPTFVKRYNPSPVYLNTWQGSLKEEYNNSEEVTATDKEQMEQILQNGINSINDKIEEVDSKLEEVNTAIEETNNLDINVSDKIDGNVTIELTKKDGTTKEVIISDGYTPVKGVDYYTEEEVQEIVDEITEKAEKDVIQANMVYNALPKVTGSGEEITLNNTAETPLKLTLKGNTYQETTTGKNLFDTGTLSTVTQNGITFTPVYNNGELLYININGTATANVFYQLQKITLPAGSYKVNGCTGGSTNTYLLAINFGGNRISQVNDDIAFTLNEERTMNESFIRVENGYTVTNQKIYPMIRLSSVSDGTYEPYTNGASPNPDYPQEVQVVTGDNTINITGKNLLNATTNSVTNPANANTATTIGTLSLTAGTTYYISYNVNNSSSTNTRNTPRLVIQGTSTVFYESTSTNYNLTTGRKVWTFNCQTTDTYRLEYWCNNPNTAITVDNFMISTSNDTLYTPYQSQNYPINLDTLELCKIGNYQDYIYGSPNNWYKKKYIGKTTDTIGSTGKTISEMVSNANVYSYCGGSINDKTITYTSALIVVNTIYYPLATPTEEPITDTTLIEQLNNLYYANSYSEQTNVSQVNSNLASIMEATAVRDLSGEF